MRNSNEHIKFYKVLLWILFSVSLFLLSYYEKYILTAILLFLFIFYIKPKFDKISGNNKVK